MSQELIQITCCLSVCFFLAALIFLPTWVYFVDPTRRLKKQEAQIAETLGWPPVAKQGQIWFKTNWYQTQLDDGRRVAFTPLLQHRKTPGYGTMGRGTAAVYVGRLAVEVLLDAPLDVVCYSYWVAPNHSSAFEQTFQGTHVENIPARTRQAMLEFTRQHGNKLRLRDRATAKPSMFPTGVLDEASVLVAHEYYLPSKLAVESTQEKVVALIDVARTLEE